MEEADMADRNHGRGGLVPSRNVQAIVMGQGRGRPPYNWALEDDWAGVMPPERALPGFLEGYTPEPPGP